MSYDEYGSILGCSLFGVAIKKSSLFGVIRNFYDAEVLAIWEVSSSMYHS